MGDVLQDYVLGPDFRITAFITILTGAIRNHEVESASKLYRPQRNEARRTGENMTGEQSRLLKVGDKICWQKDQADQGTVTEKNWAGLTIKWDNRGKQSILHNDMALMSLVRNK